MREGRGIMVACGTRAGYAPAYCIGVGEVDLKRTSYLILETVMEILVQTVIYYH